MYGLKLAPENCGLLVIEPSSAELGRPLRCEPAAAGQRFTPPSQGRLGQIRTVADPELVGKVVRDELPNLIP